MNDYPLGAGHIPEKMFFRGILKGVNPGIWLTVHTQTERMILRGSRPTGDGYGLTA